MEDFDYIGTGGFIIECQCGNALGVTKEQSERLQRECPFFQSCFKHDMIERQKGVLQKPDWTLAVARHLVEVLVKGRTALPNLELYQQVMEAGDQALVDLRLCSFVNYMDPTLQRDHRFLDLVSNPETFCFTLKANVTSLQWLELLDKDIVLNRESTNYVVKLHNDQVLSEHQMNSKRMLDTQLSEYLVHAERPVQAMLMIRDVLAASQSRDLRAPPLAHGSCTEERFSIYFETTKTIPREHHQLIARLAGGEAYIRTCADASEFQTEGYTVRASVDVLKRAIEPLICPDETKQSNGIEQQPDDTSVHIDDTVAKAIPNSFIPCSLRIDHPTPDTLGRFVNACQLAKDFPGTLGLDVSINRFFCRKSLQDVYIILSYMADYSTPAKISGTFVLHELSSEDKLF